MQHYVLRCKHCHKTYTYCTHGNDDGCSTDYCGECQTAIDKALGKIKVKFEPKFVEIKPTFGLPEMLNNIKAAKTRKEQESNFPITVCLNLPDCDYDNVEEYTHDGKTYRIAWDDGHEEELHYFVQMEYDIEKGAVTRNVWKAEDYKDSYRKGKSVNHFLKTMINAGVYTTPVTSMNEPSGLMSYMTFEPWDIEFPDIPKRIPKHELRTYTIDYDGIMLKRYIEDGRLTVNGKITISTPENFNSEDVNEMLDYEITIQKYDDENVETIVKIAVK